MEDWSARQYLKFEDERTRPPRDLLAQVPLPQPRLVVDLGCGPGNSTELLVERYPQSEIVGLEFLARHAAQGARAAAEVQVHRGRYRHLVAGAGHRSAVLQRGHAMAARSSGRHAPAAGSAAAGRRAGGADARQHARARRWCSRREVGAKRPVGGPSRSQGRAARRSARASRPITICSSRSCSHIDIWHTDYNHVMASPQAIVEWFKGSSLQPFLSPLDAADAREISRRLFAKNRRRL